MGTAPPPPQVPNEIVAAGIRWEGFSPASLPDWFLLVLVLFAVQNLHAALLGPWTAGQTAGQKTGGSGGQRSLTTTVHLSVSLL